MIAGLSSAAWVSVYRILFVRPSLLRFAVLVAFDVLTD
jgi:hypothetical protein